MVEETKKPKISIRLAEIGELTNSLKIVKELVHEVNLKIDSDGLNIVAMDPANVVMLSYKIKSAAFTELNCETPGQFGVDLTKLLPILKRIGSKEMTNIEFGDQILITTTGDRNKEFTCPVLEDVDNEKKMPPLEFKAKLKATSKQIEESILDIALASASVKFKAEKDKISIFGKGDIQSVKVDFKTDMTVEGSEESKYSLEYLQKVMKASKLSDDVTIEFSHEYPMRFTFSSGNVELQAILAPMVEND